MEHPGQAMLNPNVVYANAFGIEEETGMQVGERNHKDEPYDLADNLSLYIPTARQGFQSASRPFTHNDILVYADRHDKEDGTFTNIERATPECSDIEEVLAFNQDSRQLMVEMAEEYLRFSSTQPGGATDIRIQNRVADSSGSRKGCHDNYNIPQGSRLNRDGRPTMLPPAALRHLGARSLFSGALEIRLNDIRFAQKIDGLQLGAIGGGYGGRMYNIKTRDGGYRLEVRCGDMNISEWAALQRVGAMAAMIALCNVEELGSKLDTVAFDKADAAATLEAKAINGADFDEDGQLHLTKEQLAAINFEQHWTELFITQMDMYVDQVDPLLLKIAHERYRFAEDLKKVGARQKHLADLGDRADWAAKMTAIYHDIQKARDAGEQRSINDQRAQTLDFLYDYTGVHAKDGKVYRPSYGYGHKLRQRGHFAYQLPATAMSKTKRSPQGTRAKIRADLRETHHIRDYRWSKVVVACPERGIYEVPINDVRQTELSDAVQDVLDQIAYSEWDA